jgi:aldose 1-epimerase
VYEIAHKKDGNYLEVSNSDIGFRARIYLNQGGSLQELTLNNIQVIKEFESVSSEKKYASSILFPFTGRIENGKYTFNNTVYQLEINNPETKSAIHGLVYNKVFKILNHKTTEDSLTVSLKHDQTEREVGFPFKYSIIITYTFFKNGIELTAHIENKDDDPFPYSLGWHPYFFSENLQESKLSINSSKKIIFNKNMSPLRFAANNYNSEFQIEDKKLDDCFSLLKNAIGFKTPNYNVNLRSSASENYIQVYTPSTEKDCIAIEPLTAPPNCLNNNIGLLILNPDETYTVNWTIELEH